MRFRHRPYRLLTVAGLTLALSAAARGAGPLPADPAGLVDCLNAPEPSRRSAAARELIDLGRAARPTVLAAARGPDSVRAAAARAILLDLPWDRPDDPPAVQNLLRNYGTLPPAARAAVVGQLEDLAALTGRPAVLRLMREDPSPTVAWTAEGRLTDALDSATADELRRWAASAEDRRALPPAALAAAAEAADLAADQNPVAGADRPSTTLLRECFRRAGPFDDRAKVAAAAARLLAEAEARRDWSAALAVARRQALLAGAGGSPPAEIDGEPATSPDDPAAEAARLVLLIQADHGPLPGAAEDFAAAAAHLPNGALPLYAASRLAARWDRPALAFGLEVAAFASGGADAGGRFDTGDLLARMGWYGPAERELRAVLRLADGSGPVGAQLKANTRLRLFNVCVATRRFGAAADELQASYDLTGGQGFQRTEASGKRTDWPAAAVLTEVWRLRFLDAKARDAKPAMADAVDHMLRLDPAAAGVAPDLVLALADLGREKEIGPVFDPAYRQMKKELAERPTDPQRMNQLAWLLARSNRKLDEALKLAGEAVRRSPASAGYIDTLAEVQFRRGAFAEAASLERRALGIDPSDEFMAEQLAKFEAAAKKVPVTRPAKG